MQAPLLPAACARQGRTELDQVGIIAGQTWGASDWKAAQLTRDAVLSGGAAAGGCSLCLPGTFSTSSGGQWQELCADAM